jgi:hypothetical protein
MTTNQEITMKVFLAKCNQTNQPCRNPEISVVVVAEKVEDVKGMIECHWVNLKVHKVEEVRTDAKQMILQGEFTTYNG